MLSSAEDLYLDLLKRMLTRSGFDDPYRVLSFSRTRVGRLVYPAIRAGLGKKGLEVVQRADPDGRVEGRDWPLEAETMIGRPRLDSIQFCVTDALARGVPGDLIETGVWRGGAVIFMRGILKAHGDTTRRVWVADSFEGLPKPDVERFPEDAGDPHWVYPVAVSLEAVKENFEKYGLLDDQVVFLKGWFRDTLPTAPIERLAVLRLDGDMYESTIVALDALYPKVSVGGYVIVDDYGAVEGCRKAVDTYRAEHGITAPLQEIDWSGVFWRRSAP